MFNAGEPAEAVKRIAEDETFFKAMQKNIFIYKIIVNSSQLMITL